jgi:hypothetical protein
MARRVEEDNVGGVEEMVAASATLSQPAGQSKATTPVRVVARLEQGRGGACGEGGAEAR